MAENPLDALQASIRETAKQLGKLPATLQMVSSFWNIVIVGQIDFRQHHPGWYKLIGAINEPEFERASKTFVPAGGPIPMFQFHVGSFAITCMPDRWEIQSSDKGQQQRLVDIASLVFKKLWEIGITAFGVNAQYVLPTKAENVQKILANKIIKTDLGFPELGGVTESQFVFKSGIENEIIVISASGSPDKKSDALVVYNREYRIKGQTGYYDISEMLAPRAITWWQESAEIGNRFVERINFAAEDRNAS